jgi:hypothetical protein
LIFAGSCQQNLTDGCKTLPEKRDVPISLPLYCPAAGDATRSSQAVKDKTWFSRHDPCCFHSKFSTIRVLQAAWKRALQQAKHTWSDVAKQEPAKSTEGKTGGYPRCLAGTSLTICQCHDYPSAIYYYVTLAASYSSLVSTQKQLLLRKKNLKSSLAHQVASSFHFRGVLQHKILLILSHRERGQPFCFATFGKSRLH